MTFTHILTFFVPGKPQPGGSKKSMPIYRKGGELARRANGSVMINTIDDNEKAKDWKSVVAMKASSERHGPPLQGALRVTFRFTMPRRKGDYGTGRKAGIVKPGAPLAHSTKPDLTKLKRSTEDACTGILWVDDAQIAFDGGSCKVYGERPGVEITVEALESAATSAPTVTSPLFAEGVATC
jgi:Holliday junction resolvase RusA-like endonuclease